MHPVTQEQPLVDNTNSIAVYLTDNRIIKFYGDDYTINEASDSSYIEGVGLQSMEGAPGESRFRGSIGRAEIKEIQIAEATPLTKVAALSAVGVFGLAFLVLILVGSIRVSNI